MPSADKEPSGETGRRPASHRRRWFPAPLPLVYQLSLAITVVIVVCMGLLGTVVIYHQDRVFERQMQTLGHSLAGQIARSASEPLMADDRLGLDVLATSLVEDPAVLGTAVVAMSGQVVAKAGLTPFDAGAPLAGDRAAHRRVPAGISWNAAAEGTDEPRPVVSFAAPIRFHKVLAGHAVVTLSRSALGAFKRATVRSIAIATGLMILLGMGLAYLLSRRLSRPIHELVDANRAFDQGHYHFRFPDRRHDEIGQLMGAYNRLADSMLQKNQVEAALSRYLSPGVARAVLADLDSVELGGRRVQASVLFADIVGFTRMSEQMNPETVAGLLNGYFDLIARACAANRGMVDKFIGDEAMLVFGVPEADGDHCLHAITCALAIMGLVEHENTRRAARGEPAVQFRIGINSGSMLAGNMGARDRMEYTVVGDAVNLASRLCSAAGAGQIVISERTYHRRDVNQRVIAQHFDAIRLRGIEHPVTTYVVRGLAAPHDDVLRRQITAILDGDVQP